MSLFCFFFRFEEKSQYDFRLPQISPLRIDNFKIGKLVNDYSLYI